MRGKDNRQEHVFIPAALCKGDIDRIQGRTNTWNNKKQTFAENRNAAGMFEPLASLPTRDFQHEAQASQSFTRRFRSDNLIKDI